MQYFGRAIDSVSKTWSSINPATLSGAIDVIVVKHEDGTLNASPFHVRFGKFQLLRPSQKKVSFVVNDQLTDIPMKLGDGGEAFFVFKTDGYVPLELQTSPVISPVTSPETPPRDTSGLNDDMAYLDIGEGEDSVSSTSGTGTGRSQRIQKRLTKINIPSKVEVNGDVILDMDGYKSDNRDVKDSEVFMKQILQDEFGKDVDVNNFINKDLEGNIIRISNSPPAPDSPFSSSSSELKELNPNSSIEVPPPAPSGEKSESEDVDSSKNSKDEIEKYFLTLRLTSEQLQALPLKKGVNSLKYIVGKSTIVANLFLWDNNTPIVISDIDGTITKSDAMGHVMAMIGRDWTHEGVAELFKEINENGYNIMYLTARSVGLADTTRSYLLGIDQKNIKLPQGPVILSPDRTFQALKREIVLKKPEVFKMACLNDIRKLYFTELEDADEGDGFCGSELGSLTGIPGDSVSQVTDNDDWSDINTNTASNTGSNSKTVPELGTYFGKYDEADYEEENNDEEDDESDEEGYFDDEGKSVFAQSRPYLKGSATAKHHLLNPHHHIPNEDLTPFYAGFGNRITDAISYRSVGIPSSRIFTINPDGDVKMELLEMAGYKCSYVSIGELVDQFFPLVKVITKKMNNNVNKSAGKGISNDGETNPLTKSVLAIEKSYEEPSDGTKSMRNLGMGSNTRNKFTDFNYWRPEEVDWSLISESDDDNSRSVEGANFHDSDDSGEDSEPIHVHGSRTKKVIYDDDSEDEDGGWDNGITPESIPEQDYDYDYNNKEDDYSEENDVNDDNDDESDKFRLTRILSPKISGFWKSSSAPSNVVSASAMAPAASAMAPAASATTAISQVNVYEANKASP